MKPLFYLALGLFFVQVTFCACWAQKAEITQISVQLEVFKHPKVWYSIDFAKNTLGCVRISDENPNEILYSNVSYFKPEQIEECKRALYKDIPEKRTWISQPGNDGGGFIMTYLRADGTSSVLEVYNHSKGIQKFDEPLKKINAFIKFVYSVTTDTHAIALLDAFDDVYYEGLPIKKVSDNPLEYQIWSSIGGNAESNPELIAFIDGLPKNQCVILDCKCTLSYNLQKDLLKRYILKNSGIRFITFGCFNFVYGNMLLLKEMLKNNIQPDADDSDYPFYLANKEAVDAWLVLHEKIRKLSLEDARKSCE
jgi:hypothetical protein